MVTKPMQTICKQIEEKLKYAFSPVYLLVLDESDQHNVPPGTESHFKVILVTEKFAAQRMVARHQVVYQLLADELSNCVHALALHTYTPTEWQQRQQIVFPSPACRGGE
ncbi:DNA-binding transcriptional regulator BolA [Arsenophonus nasoniae]|uniref:DNA-binding transcriptional regulator BolA n=2 Tax=Arsenophonus nasoniae TaxID=638 RepID=D2TWC4_9GAMM|nr:DNA-binding transcriptional regulator BolA [Arsenophonus nasoniae]CBA71655.1 transcriptional regulator [Arsenophonus nasoniae]